MNQLLEYLEAEDLLNTDLQTVVDACGVTVARDLLEHCSGTIYIPRPQGIDPLVERFIQHKLNTGTVGVRVLAKQIGCSESRVRFLMERLRSKRR